MPMHKDHKHMTEKEMRQMSGKAPMKPKGGKASRKGKGK